MAWFGTVEEVFKTVGVVVRREDFVVPDESQKLGLRLDTSLLFRYLYYWAAAEAQENRQTQSQHCATIAERLLTVSKASLSSRSHQIPQDIQKIEDGCTPIIADDEYKTWLAISVLAETLTAALNWIYHTHDNFRHPDFNIGPRLFDPLPKQFMISNLRQWQIQAGWCPTEIVGQDFTVPLYAHLPQSD